MSVTLNPDAEVVKTIKEGLALKGGYCPCRLERSEANKCICEEFRQQIADPDLKASATACCTINPSKSSLKRSGEYE